MFFSYNYVGVDQECWNFTKNMSYLKMAYKAVLNILLVLISGCGFIFAFVVGGSLVSFLSYIPSQKPDVPAIRGNFFQT